MQHWTIHVRGRVQGVGYRAFVARAAQELHVKGLVRNEPDGTVYIEAEAEENVLDVLVERCLQGPPHARVDSVDTARGHLQHYETFTIQR